MRHNRFDLYESMEGWQDAENDIAAVLRAEINLVNAGKKDAADGWKEVKAVLRKYAPWGATDTEPRNACAHTFGRSTGTEPEDWVWA